MFNQIAVPYPVILKMIRRMEKKCVLERGHEMSHVVNMA
uniref:Uncharacterized protein n=1 Tax=Picea sitchensis TaxID=3332 RepID=A9NTR7_PICSI|nr:unknown [Picea sitchensis]